MIKIDRFFLLGRFVLRQVARRDSDADADAARMYGGVLDALKCPMRPVGVKQHLPSHIPPKFLSAP
jgi:hypothetical protein